MNVLIAAASKHGATADIGEAIAAELRTLGIAAQAREIDDDLVVEDADAVVVGSAIYMGRWLPEAARFLDRNRGELATVPVWLFSSGPLGAENPKPEGDPAQLDDLIVETGAREHRIFVGKLDKVQLGFGERLAVRLIHAPVGDFRDWDAIRTWAREIGEALLASSGPVDGSALEDTASAEVEHTA